MKKRTLPVLLATFVVGLASQAAAADYDFEDPKGVNNISFTLDATLESVSGTATGISGTVAYDHTNPAATSGSIAVASESLHVGNPKMKEHLHSAGWVNVGEFPEIVFELASLHDVVTEGNKTEAIAKGTLTLKGVTKTIEAPVSLTYLEGYLAKRFPKKEGDLLVLRSTFSISRKDFGIKPGKVEDKIADEIVLSLSIAGGAES